MLGWERDGNSMDQLIISWFFENSNSQASARQNQLNQNTLSRYWRHFLFFLKKKEYVDQSSFNLICNTIQSPLCFEAKTQKTLCSSLVTHTTKCGSQSRCWINKYSCVLRSCNVSVQTVVLKQKGSCFYPDSFQTYRSVCKLAI